MSRFVSRSMPRPSALALTLLGCTLVAALPGCAVRPLDNPYSTAAGNAAMPTAMPGPAGSPATRPAVVAPPVAAAAMPASASAAAAPAAASGPACAPINESQVAMLFDRWNASLLTHDPRKVVENYAPHSILLPTVSNKPRYSVEDKIDYFVHFLHDGPVGKIDQRFIQVGCNTALDAGLYTFTFFKTGKVVNARYSYTYGYINGQWLITSHHSSGMPEKAPEPAAPAAPTAAPEHAPAAKTPAKAPAKASAAAH